MIKLFICVIFIGLIIACDGYRLMSPSAHHPTKHSIFRDSHCYTSELSSEKGFQTLNTLASVAHSNDIGQLSPSNQKVSDQVSSSLISLYKPLKAVALAVITASFLLNMPTASVAADSGANDNANTKIRKGGASTLQQGIAKTITRGVNLDGTDFEGQDLHGVSFQQSIIRDSNFKRTDLRSASFFDATVDGSCFDEADMTLANVELAQFNRASMKQTLAREMYVVGLTSFEGVVSIEGSDWTDTNLSRAQKQYLCNLPSATGTNIKTGVDTRESLLCD